MNNNQATDEPGQTPQAAASKTPSTAQTPTSETPPALGLKITIESLNYQLRKIIKNRGHFPNDNSAVKLLWLAICNIEDKRARERSKLHGKVRDNRSKSVHTLIEGSFTQGWSEALGALALAYPERIEPHLN